MAVPNSNLTELITTTLRDRAPTIADNFTDNNAILRQLKKRGNIRTFSGGRTMVEPIFYQDNSTYTRYSGYDLLNVQPSDVITAAEYEIKQVAVSVSISGLEQLQNTGKNAIIDWLAARIENAEGSMENGLAADLYSAGTADGGKQIGGLQSLVADTPTSGTVGGIDRLSYSFWRNYYYDATTDGGAAVTAANIQDYMHNVYLNTCRGNDKIDLILADNTYYKAYWESLTAIQRITNADTASAGFTSLDYMGAPVIFDGGVQGNCPSNHMYFLNSKYLKFRPHADRNMDVIGSDRFSVNQDAMVRLIGWAGNMTASGCKFLGVLKD